MRRLTAIGPAGLDLIVRANRNVERLFLISIEITEQETVCAVGILEPTLKGSRDALADVVGRLEGKLLREKKRTTKGTKKSKRHKKYVPFVFLCVFCGHSCCCAI